MREARNLIESEWDAAERDLHITARLLAQRGQPAPLAALYPRPARARKKSPAHRDGSKRGQEAAKRGKEDAAPPGAPTGAVDEARPSSADATAPGKS